MLLVNIQNKLGGHYCTERPERNSLSHYFTEGININPYQPAVQPSKFTPRQPANHQLYILEDKCLDPAIDDDYTLIS